MHSWMRRMLAVTALLLGVPVGAFHGSAPASAGSGNDDCVYGCSDGPPVDIDGGTVSGSLAAQYEALQNGGSGSGAEPPPCDYVGEDGENGYYRWAVAYGDDSYEFTRDPDAPKTGTYYRYECYHPEMGENGQQEEPPAIDGICGDYDGDGDAGRMICYFDQINPEGLAQLAVDQFVRELDAPEPQFSPSDMTLVRFDTWMWVENLESQQQDFPRIEVPGQWVETSASFEEVEWEMGDGSAPVRCPLATDADSAQQNGCTHKYERSSAGEPNDEFHGTVSVVWEVTYTGMFIGQPVGDTLEVLLDNEFTLAVAESQAIVTE